MVPEREMTSVIVVEDLVQQALLESVLRESGVPYVITNAGVQNLLGIGQIGGSNLLAPVEIQVPRAELDRARNLIAAALGESTVDGSALEDPALEEEPEGPQPDEGQAEIQTDEVAARYSRYSVVWAVLWLGGVGSLLAMYFGIRALTLLRSAPATVKTKAIFGVTFGGMGLILWLLIWGTLFRH
jgi:hypothetical protein